MDGTHFDSLTRSLNTPDSRRGALGGLLARVLSLVGVRADEATAKKKPCPPCKKRKAGKCKKKLPDGTACGDGKTCQSGRCVAAPPPPCQGKPDNTPCNGTGRCLLGQCNPQPTCQMQGTDCDPANSNCCDECVFGGIFHPYICAASTAGSKCHVDADCPSALRCVGYVCLSTKCEPGENVCGDLTAVCGVGNAGGCLLPVDGGPSRCGGELTATCGCTSHQECAGLGLGAFCAQTPGVLCECESGATTRCVPPA